MTNKNEHPSSFRDPSGFVYTENGKILRQVNFFYQENYDNLIKSGLYQDLVNRRLLISHKVIPVKNGCKDIYKILQPQPIPFISYPYEWSFGMLKDAALLTLKIQKIALEHDMSLKDATGFNVQFQNGKPIFIDTLSFEKYEEDCPWIAYKQFCEQFLAPLALMAHVDVRLCALLKSNLNGIPLDLSSKLLPLKAKLNLSLFLHIHSHAKSQQKHASTALNKSPLKKFGRTSHLGLIDNLESGINSLSLNLKKTTWSDYYSKTNYADSSFQMKAKIVSEFLGISKTKYVWDLGANDGHFSRLAAKLASLVVSIDNDTAVVEKNYQEIKKNSETNILPLIIDLTNPTPAIGWESMERDSFTKRPHPDTILALALIHHLAITNNVPLQSIAKFLAGICTYLIIEFIPKNDSQVKILLQSRQDIFPNYTQESFESEFSRLFKILQKKPVAGTSRTIYLLKII